MKQKVLFGLSLLLGLMMANSGLNKFLHYMALPEMNAAAGATMGAFAESGWLFPLVGIVEIIGGVLLIIPKYRALGAVMLLPIVVGIAAFHFSQEPSGNIMSVILLAVLGWVIYENRGKYMPMIEG